MTLPTTPAEVAPELSVVLPCFRHATLARRSADELSSFLRGGNRNWEIIIVDDGGGDFPPGLWDDGGPVRLLRLPVNQGKGAAIRAGMLEARGRARIFTDIDLPFELDLLQVMADYILDRGFHLAVGDRTLAGSSYALDVGWKRRLASATFSQFVGKLVTGGFFDTQCGLKGFRADVAEAIFRCARVDRFAFDVEILYMALKYRLDIKRVPVCLRHNDSSSVRLFRDSMQMLWDVLRIKQMQVQGQYASQDLEALVAQDFARDREKSVSRMRSS